MAYDERLVLRVRRLLGSRRNVVEKKMMGTLVFMVGGAMCVTVGSDGLLVRVRAEERDEALAGPHVEPMRMGRRIMSGFVRVGWDGLRTRAALAKWIERGIRAAQDQRHRR